MKTLERISTFPDDLLRYIAEHAAGTEKTVLLADAVRDLHKDLAIVEAWSEFLERQGLLEIIYPLNIVASPKLRLKHKEQKKEHTLDVSKARLSSISEYEINSDGMTAMVKVWKAASEDVPLYELITPALEVGTEALVTGLQNELTKTMTLEPEEASDPKKQALRKKKQLGIIFAAIRQYLPGESDDIVSALSSILYHRIEGLGIIDVILADDRLEEIAINGAQETISVYHKQFGWLRTYTYVDSENQIFNLASQIGRKSGQQINSLHPIMDAHLISGDRIAATLYPISTNGNTITIRRFSRSPWTIPQFLGPQASLMSKRMAAFIWLAMQYELNIIIAGGTASGKTSVMNALSSLIPPTNRVLSVEDTREIQLPQSLHWNWVPMTSKNPNPEGKGEISMLDLIIAALRMRPDRIVVGEIRKREQAQALFEAMHTGHSVYATMHADTSAQVVRRLLEPPLEIPQTEIGSLHLIVIQFRDRRTGKRRTKEIVEIIDSKELELNHLFRWDPRTDAFETVRPSRRVFEEISLHAGLTPKEIETDLKERESILQWMVDMKINELDQVGQVMRIYYRNKELLLECIRKKGNCETLIELFERSVSGPRADEKNGKTDQQAQVPPETVAIKAAKQEGLKARKTAPSKSKSGKNHPTHAPVIKVSAKRPGKSLHPSRSPPPKATPERTEQEKRRPGLPSVIDDVPKPPAIEKKPGIFSNLWGRK